MTKQGAKLELDACGLLNGPYEYAHQLFRDVDRTDLHKLPRFNAMCAGGWHIICLDECVRGRTISVTWKRIIAA